MGLWNYLENLTKICDESKIHRIEIIILTIWNCKRILAYRDPICQQSKTWFSFKFNSSFWIFRKVNVTSQPAHHHPAPIERGR